MSGAAGTSGAVYAAFGRRISVKMWRPGKWHVIGIARGREHYPIKRLGISTTREAAQARLDGWARNMGLHPLPIPR
jgi:hypothetical protein